MHILSPSWLAGWLVHILARVGNSDDCKDAVTIFSFGEIFLYGDGSEGNKEKNMLSGKTIKVVRAGSFEYWAQGYTLRSPLAVT